MRDRDTELEYLKACASLVRVRSTDHGFEALIRPDPARLIDEFVRRTGDGPIRPHIIELGDKEGREEAVDGSAYGAWRNLYADSTPYAKSLRAQAIGHFIAAHHLLYMAEEADQP